MSPSFASIFFRYASVISTALNSFFLKPSCNFAIVRFLRSILFSARGGSAFGGKHRRYLHILLLRFRKRVSCLVGLQAILARLILSKNVLEFRAPRNRRHVLGIHLLE